jgi:hypothetical protein
MNERYFVSTHDEGRTTPICIDIIRQDGRSAINWETKEEIEKRFPNVQIMNFDEFRVLQEETTCTQPEEITKEKFIEMLEVLPPMKWNNRGYDETFMMCEFWTGRITGIYCRIADRYFTFLGICTLTHSEIVRKCLEFIKENSHEGM